MTHQGTAPERSHDVYDCLVHEGGHVTLNTSPSGFFITHRLIVTKFEMLRFTRAKDRTGAPKKLKRRHVTLTTPIWGSFVTHRLGLNVTG